MITFMYFIGSDGETTFTRAHLEEDIAKVLGKHGANLHLQSQIDMSRGWNLAVIYSKIYEIPSIGAIAVQTSDKRVVVYETPEEEFAGNAQVTCFGFDESGETFRQLHGDLEELIVKYNGNRK
jgi:hypothetical protein